ncbi:MAG: aldo/keto reductase [Acidobacteria bacterium]|nr:aldo/keto reductase [Acidobacteriota bacterium]
MQTRKLGNSDLEITRMGIGAWAMGGAGWAFSWSSQEDSDSVAAIRRAVEHGVNWVDTAAVYGLGHSEEVVGEAVKGLAKKPYIFTKCARVWNENREIGKCIKRDSVRRECEASLRRLQVDVIDLYQMHWPEPDEDLEEGFSAMLELQHEGKVRWVGVSNCNVSQMKRVQAIGAVTSLQPPYSLVSPEVETEILPHALATGVGAIVYSPMKAGLLSGKMTRERALNLPADDWRRRNPAFQEPALTRNVALADLLGEIGKPYGRSAGEVAIAWTLLNPAVTGAIVGMRNAEQVDGVIGAADLELSAGDVERIETFRRG